MIVTERKSVKLEPRKDRDTIRMIRAYGVRNAARLLKCSPAFVSRWVNGLVAMTEAKALRIFNAATGGKP